MFISIARGTTEIVLNGTEMTAPVRGCRFVGDRLDEGVLRLEILLEGTQLEMNQWLNQAEQMTEGGARDYGVGGGSWAYVVVESWGRWRTPMAKVRWGYMKAGGRSGSPSPAARDKGSQGITLEVERPDWWEGVTEITVPLTNRKYSSWYGTLALDNASLGTNYDNSARIEEGNIEGDLPAPAVLRLSGGTAGVEVLVGHQVDGDQNFTFQLEGENASTPAGATGTNITNSAGNSNNAYREVSWSATTPVTLLQWLNSEADTAKFRGRYYRPVLRLNGIWTGGTVWVWLRAGYNNGGAVEGYQDYEGILIPYGKPMVVLPPVQFPPWQQPPEGITQWENGAIALMGHAEAAGTKSLQVDYLQLVPIDSWARFIPTVMTLAPEIRYEGSTGTLSRYTKAMTGHAVEGPGVLLEPGKSQRIFALNYSNAGAPIGQTISLGVRYRPRRRTV